ncbi:WS/DGAT domain-containing protein, partial [Parasphingorhabdus sp.]
ILAEGQGLFHVVTSYNGNVILSFLGDRELLPDPDNYATCISRSFADLMAAAVDARKGDKKKAQKKAGKKTAAKKSAAKKPKKRVRSSAATAGRVRRKAAAK